MIFLALFKEIFVLGQKRSLMLEAVFFHRAVGIQHLADMEFVEFQLTPDMRLVPLSNIQHPPTIPNMILNLINAAPALIDALHHLPSLNPTMCSTLVIALLNNFKIL